MCTPRQTSLFSANSLICVVISKYPGRYQQDDRADGGNGAYERRYQSAEEAILDEGQRNGHEHLTAVRAHIVRAFLNGAVNLPQGGNAASCTHGQATHDKHDHQNRARAV